MFKVGTVLNLDDGKDYAVVTNINFQNKIYIYLIDINDNTNMMFCELENDELVAVKDIELIKQLSLLYNLLKA